MNRLSGEKSPYLQMHAENPVDWYPWNEEAFREAQRQDKPILLSIGYSACHWCHVIAHESFEDEGIAQLLNENWISIKVDKEERPDVDAVYMDAVELATGSGGWPMTILMLPDGKPFYAATYLPRETFANLLERAAFLWDSDRQALHRLADDLTGSMRTLANRAIQPVEPKLSMIQDAFTAYASGYDQRWGGFGSAPKFPSAHNLLFLLKHHEQTGSASALSMVEGTLNAMYRGGMFDHIGGGFSRYSVDRQWLVPHFEKMLYDNALLLWAYSEAWRITHRPIYRTVAERTAAYVLREMTSPEGAFYSAQDADSEGEEGAYYVFTRKELISLLGRKDGNRFCEWYSIKDGGNFEGKSIPNLISNPDWENEPQQLSAMRDHVYQYRKDRLVLNRDDKVLASWNALMITALCQAAYALKRPEYLEAARRAESFLQNRLVGKDGSLLLRWRDGEARGDGVLADYAYYALALLSLHEGTGEQHDLKRAEIISKTLLDRFSDAQNSGFYLYSQKGEQLVTRPKDMWDAAMPSGNSCAALVLWKLSKLTDHAQWRSAAEKQMRFIAGAASEHPTAHGFGLFAMTHTCEKELIPQL